MRKDPYRHTEPTNAHPDCKSNSDAHCDTDADANANPCIAVWDAWPEPDSHSKRHVHANSDSCADSVSVTHDLDEPVHLWHSGI